MAQHFTDFSSGAIGATPTGTTLILNSVEGDFVNEEDGGVRVLRYRSVTSVDQFRGLSYEALQASGKTQVKTLFKNGGSTFRSSRLIAFQTDGDNTYRTVFIPATGDLSLQKVHNGTFAVMAETTIPGTDTTKYYNWLFEVEPGTPNTLRAKVWDEGATEPSVFNIDATDSQRDISTGGSVGQVAFQSGLSLYHKFFSIGTDGDLAPNPPPAATTLDVPLNLVGVLNSGSVNISWDAVTGADYYEYEFRQV